MLIMNKTQKILFGNFQRNKKNKSENDENRGFRKCYSFFSFLEVFWQ